MKKPVEYLFKHMISFVIGRASLRTLQRLAFPGALASHYRPAANEIAASADKNAEGPIAKQEAMSAIRSSSSFLALSVNIDERRHVILLHIINEQPSSRLSVTRDAKPRHVFRAKSSILMNVVRVAEETEFVVSVGKVGSFVPPMLSLV